MARKKKPVETEITEEQLNAHILGAGEVVTQNITETKLYALCYECYCVPCNS